MKKLLTALLFALLTSSLYSDSAFDQLQDASSSSQQGADKAGYGDYEGAKNDSGASFDGNDYDSTPPVDLTGKEGVVDPNDLKQYDPPSDNGGPIE